MGLESIDPGLNGVSANEEDFGDLGNRELTLAQQDRVGSGASGVTGVGFPQLIELLALFYVGVSELCCRSSHKFTLVSRGEIDPRGISNCYQNKQEIPAYN